MAEIFTMAFKDLRILWRDKFGMFWVVVFPLLMALFFGSMFSGEGSRTGSMKIALVGDTSQPTEAFFKQLSSSSVLKASRMPLDSARGLVAHGKLTAYVRYLPADTASSSMMMFGKDSIEVGIDPSRKAESAYLQGLISQAYFTQLQSQFTNPKKWQSQIKKEMTLADSIPGMSSDQKTLLKGFYTSLDTFLKTVDTTDTVGAKENSPFGDIKIKFSDVTNAENLPRSSWEITFPQSLLWALIGCAATFALSIVTERRTGTYLRLRLAPINRIQILIGKGLACFIACVVVSALLMGFGIVVFGVRVGSPLLLAVAIMAAAFCFVGIMMLISVLGKTERTVAGSSWAILLVFSMVGGGMIPIMFMPSWVAAVSNFSPMKWCVFAAEGAIWRGFSPSDMMFPVGILFIIGLVGFVIGSFVLARSER